MSIGKDVHCAWCRKPIDPGRYHSGAGELFCSDVCLLRFYKENLSNIVGHVISEEDIKRIEQSTGNKRRELLREIHLRMMGGVETSNLSKHLDSVSDDQGNFNKSDLEKWIEDNKED